MNFADAMRIKGSYTETENGAVALSSTGNACLDLFGLIGGLREADDIRINTLFAEAYRENSLYATKIVFYARDIRGGLGERQTFRTLLRYMAERHPETVRPNLDLIGVYGRFDDLYTLIGTSLEDQMWAVMKEQFEEDLNNLRAGNAISMLAKWIKTADSHSENTRELGILTAQKLGYTVYEFKRLVRAMRKSIRIVESIMVEDRWDEIQYAEIPSRAMLIYRKAFLRHDKDRFKEFIKKVETGEEKINAGTLFPYDIVEKLLYYWGHDEDARLLEAQWAALPDFVEKGSNVLIMADTSGSMAWGNGRPLATAIGLAIYFAERNAGAYQNMFMTFSGEPEVVLLKGETLKQKVRSAQSAKWGNNTDLKAGFELILRIARNHEILPEEMPKAICVISDMEIDDCGNREWTFYDKMTEKYAKHGYRIPNVIFWNVNSRHNIFHADKSRKGVQLASGQSVAVFKQVLQNIGCDPVEAMENVINTERYDCIRVE